MLGAGLVLTGGVRSRSRAPDGAFPAGLPCTIFGMSLHNITLHVQHTVPSALPLADRFVLLTTDSVPPNGQEETTTAWEAIALPALGIADWRARVRPCR